MLAANYSPLLLALTLESVNRLRNDDIQIVVAVRDELGFLRLSIIDERVDAVLAYR